MTPVRDLRRRLSRVGALALTLALTLAACTSDESSDSKRSRAKAADSPQVEAGDQPQVEGIATFAVGKIEQTFVDDSRATPANGSFPGAPGRTLKTTIYYPAEGEPGDAVVENARPRDSGAPYPLILFSHGYTAFGSAYEGLLKKYASAGYVVAAPDYPLSNGAAPGGPSVTDTGEQPEDASFVIDQVLAQDEHLLEGIVDDEHIGASGHSLGGITTYLLTYEVCCAENRIDAAVPMSGVAGGAEEFFGTIDTPLLILHGDADPLISYDGALDAYAQANTPKMMVTFTGAGHVSPFLGGDDEQAVVLQEVAVAFFDRYLKEDDGGLDRLRGAVTQPDLATLTEQP